MESLLLIAIGLAAGLLSATLGVGGGVIIVPALTFIVGLKAKTAMGTSLLVIVPTAIVGACMRMHFNNVNTKVALFVAIGAVAGAVLGAKIGQVASETLLKRLFAALLLFTATQMFVSTLPKRTQQPPAPHAAVTEEAPVGIAESGTQRR